MKCLIVIYLFHVLSLLGLFNMEEAEESAGWIAEVCYRFKQDIKFIAYFAY